MEFHSNLRELGGLGYRSQGRSEPGYGLPEMVHVLHRLRVATDLAFIRSHSQIPVK